MQAATGCTIGHGIAFAEDYGKLALTLGDIRTKKGMRVALNNKANNHSSLINKWMMRFGKLSHEEEEELGMQLLDMDEKYFLIKHVEIEREQNFEKSGIITCSICGELIPQVLTAIKNNLVYYNACCGKAYYKLIEDYIMNAMGELLCVTLFHSHKRI